MNQKQTKITAVGGKIWFSLIFFGLIGQIAWIVENMYFATFAQDVFANSGRSDMSYVVTTLMVVFSAIAATITTIFAGSLIDHTGKRKPFIAYGYIVWGITIMLFALIPMKVEQTAVVFIATILVVFDCIMTIAGSTANDAAFNTWVVDNSDSTNRGKINAILAMLPVFAVVIVFIGLGSLYNSENESNFLFFIVLGIIPIIAGILAIFILKDAKNIKKEANKGKIEEVFYGFKKENIIKNKMLYVCLIAACLIGIAQQTFFSYLINFLIITLDLKDGFVIPMAIIIVGAAIVTAIAGFLSDKFGRKHFYVPLFLICIIGILSFYFIQYFQDIKMIVLYVGGVLMMGGILGLTGLLSSTFQDYIPSGCEGRFQGIRMCFVVLIPMIIGPIISLIIGLDAMGMNGDNFIPPYGMFLAAAIVAVFAIIPMIFVIKDAENLQNKLLQTKKTLE